MTRNKECYVCGTTDNLQPHHITYTPEKTVNLCLLHHFCVGGYADWKVNNYHKMLDEERYYWARAFCKSEIFQKQICRFCGQEFDGPKPSRYCSFNCQKTSWEKNFERKFKVTIKEVETIRNKYPQLLQKQLDPNKNRQEIKEEGVCTRCNYNLRDNWLKNRCPACGLKLD